MMERSDKVRLADGEARCFPSGECKAKASCARILAVLQKTGASIMDGYAETAMLRGVTPSIPCCSKYINVHVM